MVCKAKLLFYQTLVGRTFVILLLYFKYTWTVYSISKVVFRTFLEVCGQKLNQIIFIKVKFHFNQLLSSNVCHTELNTKIGAYHNRSS